MPNENADPNTAENIFFLPQKSLDTMEKTLKKGGEFSKDDIYAFTSPEGVSDKEIIVPVDLRAISENFEEDFEDDFDVMVDKLGPKGTAEGFLKARKYFKENKGKEPADKRASDPLPAKKWKEMAADQDDDDEEEEDADAEEAEEEDAEGEEEEEEEGDDEEAEEPPAKKSKK